jgi:hypothetical protein
VLPTFLGIGVPKAGTTWICDLLRTHPQVAIASRKELHYFDRNFDKGIAWYEQFFSGRPGVAAVGEFTTHYLFDPVVPARVRSIASINRLILCLRNPVDRAVSHYRFRQQVDNYRGSFDEFLQEYPNALEWGRYATHLRPWLDHFDLNSFVFIVQEQAAGDLSRTKARLAEALGIDEGAFPPDVGLEPSNASFRPMLRRAYSAATRQSQFLRRHDLDWAIELGRRLGVKRLLSTPGRHGEAAPVGQDARERLWAVYAPGVEALESMSGLDLSLWRHPLGS